MPQEKETNLSQKIKDMSGVSMVRVLDIKDSVKKIRDVVMKECKGTKANCYNLNLEISRILGGRLG